MIFLCFLVFWQSALSYINSAFSKLRNHSFSCDTNIVSKIFLHWSCQSIFPSMPSMPFSDITDYTTNDGVFLIVVFHSELYCFCVWFSSHKFSVLCQKLKDRLIRKNTYEMKIETCLYFTNSTCMIIIYFFLAIIPHYIKTLSFLLSSEVAFSS